MVRKQINRIKASGQPGKSAQAMVVACSELLKSTAVLNILSTTTPQRCVDCDCVDSDCGVDRPSAPRQATLTEEHRRQAELLDHLSQQRDPKARPGRRPT